MLTILSNLPVKLAACAILSLPLAVPRSSPAGSPATRPAPGAQFDTSLGAMRAGHIEAPAPFGARERAVLASAQEGSAALATLRAGSAPTDEEWKWLAIGAGVVLLIVLI